MRTTVLRVLMLEIIGLSVAACVPPADLARLQQELQSRLPSSVSAPGIGAAPDAATTSAIELVIQRGDFEQEQAIASRDPSAMKDTSTDSYYQQTVQDNQQLLNSGVTSIKLDSINWGPVTVDGNQATATADETWTSTYADGTTKQASDRNVYGLVAQNGSWKIQSDDHPDSGSGGPRAGSSGAAAGSGGAAAGSGGATSGSGATATPADTSAIQDVIQRGNAAQAAAIAARDPSGMKDTATDSYYQGLVLTNQNMLASGVTSIKLVNLTWGPITVTGTSATATTYETWTTTYSDGRTDQEPADRNVYTLVEQNGAWKIQSDDHPDNSTPLPGRGIQISSPIH